MSVSHSTSAAYIQREIKSGSSVSVHSQREVGAYQRHSLR